MHRPVLALACGLAVSTAAAAPPNIVFIYTDDQGPWTIKNAHPDLKTPNIDRICDEGALLTQCFATTPVCSPARASVITSRYGTELGITDWIDPKLEPDLGLDPGIITWPKLLADAGYQTALFGKWHLGTQDRYHPTNFGFETFVGFRAGGNKPRNPTLEVNGKDRKVSGFLTDILTDRAVEFIREHRDKPFLVCLHHRSPHSPYIPVPDEIWSQFSKLDAAVPDYPDLDLPRIKTAMAQYLASIADVDRTVGRVLQLLDETKLADRTVLVFTSDQGYNVGHHGVLYKGNARWVTLDKKGLSPLSPAVQRPNIFDTSLRVPAAIRWPGTIKPGTVIDRTVSALDFYPTFCAIAGVELPKNPTIRGRDLTPLLKREKIPWDDELYAEYSQHHYTRADLRMWRTPEWKLVRDFRNPGKDEFYHLTRDPEERDNLIDSTDVEVLRILRECNEKLLARMREINDPLLTTLQAPQQQ